MKSIKLFAVVCSVLLLFTACGNKKKQKDSLGSEYIRPASMTYSKNDTSEINRLVDSYVAFIADNDYKKAADLLNFVKNDSIVPYTDKDKADFVDALSHLKIYNCKVKSLVLRSDKNNEVQIALQIIASGDIDKNDGVTIQSLNPVYKDGKWYLTLLDEYAEGVENVYKKEYEEAQARQ